MVLSFTRSLAVGMICLATVLLDQRSSQRAAPVFSKYSSLRVAGTPVVREIVPVCSVVVGLVQVSISSVSLIHRRAPSSDVHGNSTCRWNWDHAAGPPDAEAIRVDPGDGRTGVPVVVDGGIDLLDGERFEVLPLK